MSRPLRIEYPGAFYHVMNRGAERRSIFLDPLEDRALFLRVLGEAAHLWNIRIHAYSLMDNHYHLLMETPLPNLSRAMRHIDGVYTQRLNRRVRRDGALFRGRFKSILVQKETYFLELVRHIHLNGVRAMRYPSPGFDPNCSHSEYLGIRAKPPWLVTALALSLFGSDERDGVGGFDAFVRAGVSEELQRVLDRKRWPAILGVKKFIDDIRAQFGLGRPAHEEKPQERELEFVAQRSAMEVLLIVAGLFGVEIRSLQVRSSKKLARARQVAVYLLRHTCRLSYSEIGAQLGGLRTSAVGYILDQVKAHPFDAELRDEIALAGIRVDWRL